MSYPTIAVMGGDLRQKWLAYTLAQQNLLSAVYALPDFSQIDAVILSNLEALNQYQCVIGPVPLARNGAVVLPAETQPLYLTELLQRLQPGQLLAGGNLPADFIQQCHQKKIITYDFMQSPELALANAEITAEGMIAILLQQTPYILQNTSLLLLGYGRCGMILAQKLTALGCHVSICETDALKRSLACSFGYTVLAPASYFAELRAAGQYGTIFTTYLRFVTTVTITGNAVRPGQRPRRHRQKRRKATFTLLSELPRSARQNCTTNCGRIVSQRFSPLP